MSQFAVLLKQTMGLDVASVGPALIERAVQTRMEVLGLLDPHTYFLSLHGNAAELQELIELVIVPETWFFRDREAIIAVAAMARELIFRTPERPIRILSLPCSTGEEPYSIAMAMLEVGMPAARFQIDAIDICTRSLASAAEGVYGRNSFRGKLLDYRDRFFTPQDTNYVLDEAVKKQVRFRYGNLFAADFLTMEAPYDFVFCRNVLIYFDRPMQEQAVQVLERMVKEEGTIFVGPAEAGLMLRNTLTSAAIPLAFAFHKKKPTVKLVIPPRAPLPVVRSAPPAVAVKSAVRTPPPVRRQMATASQPQPQTTNQLQQALQLADQGRLSEAADLCAAHLKEHGPNADAFYLQGLISDARQDSAAAIQQYRKAIYLQPGHQEALEHLAALMEMQGDHSGAERIMRRAQRLKEQQDA